MKFNHLVPKADQLNKCEGIKEHYWVPLNVQASTARNVGIYFVCKRCSRRTHEFMTFDQYQIHEKVLLKQIEKETGSL